MPDREVLVTGLGAVTPLGRDVPSLWEALLAGRSGIGRIEAFDASQSACRIAGEVRGYTPHPAVPAENAAALDRASLFAVDAAFQALEDSRLPLARENSVHAGLVLGASGSDGRAAETVAAALGVRGPTLTVVAGEASAGAALAVAASMVRRGELQVAIAGGVETPINRETVAALSGAGRLSRRNDEPERASRPFDADADGYVLAEGAGVLVLENEELARGRSARVYGELAGAASITEPDARGPGVEEAGRAMQLALRQPALLQGEIDYYCAFAPGEPAIDRAETAALKRIFGEVTASKLTVSAPKSMLGHLLGASSAIDAIVCLKAIERGAVPPTANLERPAEGCDLDYTPGAARELPVRHALTYAYGSGGHHVACCFSAP